MFYYLYKITNWFNGKIYIGAHKTDDLNDGYMGSGKMLKLAIKKYGIEYFTKEILQQFESIEEMFEAESQIVNEEFIKDDYVYNIKQGGLGYRLDYHTNSTKEAMKKAWEKRRLTPVSEETKRKISESMKNHIVSEETKRKISESKKGRSGFKPSEETKEKLRKISQNMSEETKKLISNSLTGRTHSEETKKKIAISNQGIKRSEETKRKMKEAQQIRRLKLKETFE